jgi:N-acetyl-anhydromuramyl-L-alanine amidase AmpD
VLHHSASPSGNYAQIDKEHRKILGFDGCGYHFVIGNGQGSEDGKIEVAQRWVNQKQGVHCRNAKSHDMDEYGVGICLIGDMDQEPPTAKQVAAAQALIAYLGGRYRIKNDHVTTHAHVASTPTVCPGKYFPEESVLTGKRNASNSGAARATSILLDRQDY